MDDREKVITQLESMRDYHRSVGNNITADIANDAIVLLKEQEPIKPTINEYGEAYCICGENVGIIPNSKNLPKIRLKYCSECGRRMKWE